MLVSQSCLTLCDPLDCSPWGSYVHGFSRQEYWNGLPSPPPGIFLTQGSNWRLTSPALADQFFTTRLPRPGRAPGSFQSVASVLGLEAIKSVCAFQEWGLGFLQPSGKPHWFSNQLNGLAFWYQTPGIDCLICCSNPSL